MFFNSFAFLVFFVAVFSCYVCLGHRWQNRLLLTASYFFYSAWDYRFCALLLTTTVIDYTAGRLLSTDVGNRRAVLTVSIACNLLILGFFKYFNFFTESLVSLLSVAGIQLTPVTLAIVLPVGISFYTFQSMSYTIDVYRKEVQPVRNFLDYALYVSFFPQLVAGPIERAQQLLPQILAQRKVTFAGLQRGFYYIAIGLLLKIFMADNIARLIDPIFAVNNTATGLEYLLAGYGFAFQIYGDFAGYSYIAKGLGAMLGFDIMDNFRLPYFSSNPQEFWRRWHISLSTWLRDYLYIPLGGSRASRSRTVRNLLITMLLGGLWHGAKITFVLWGLVHGLMLVGYHLLSDSFVAKRSQRKIPRALHKAINITLFFHLIVITWYFFRAESVAQLATIGRAILLDFQPHGQTEMTLKLLFYILPVLIFQLIQFWSNNLLVIFRLPVVVRAGAYVVIFYLVVIFGVNHAQDFIYFQF